MAPRLAEPTIAFALAVAVAGCGGAPQPNLVWDYIPQSEPPPPVVQHAMHIYPNDVDTLLSRTVSSSATSR